LHRLTRIAICYAEGEIKENSNKAHFSPTARPSLGRCPHARKEFDMNTLKLASTREWFTPVWVVPIALLALVLFYALLLR
jgi:hypothetical protein